jgi:hypothetical protein
MGTGETAGYHRDHGPGDHRGVMVGQPLVVAHGAAMLGDLRQGPLHHPPARQHLEGRLARALAHDLDPQAQHRRSPGDQPAGIPAIGQQSRTPRKLARRRHSSARPASRSWMLVAVTMTTSSNPRVSTAARCRLRPLTFLPASHPRLRRGTVSAVRTDWESMIAAEGTRLRPRWSRTCSRSVSCTRARDRRRPTWQTTSTPCPGWELVGPPFHVAFPPKPATQPDQPEPVLKHSLSLC